MTDTASGKTEVSDRRFPPARAELALLAAIVLVGFALRCAYPSRMAVEHFDEGVYASNFWFGAAESFRYPDRHLYAPPLLPWLVEWCIVFFGPSHAGSMLVGLIFGGLTIPLIWWVARSWFGPEAGLAAAALTALSDVHIVYSRTVLTDVPLCFWLLLAVYLVGRAYRTGRPGWIPAAGIAAGLAWSTKYNGWLPLAIGLAGLVPWVVFNRAHNRPTEQRSSTALWFVVTAFMRSIRRAAPMNRGTTNDGTLLKCVLLWAGMTIVAGAVWFPAWYDLQQAGRGGYEAVAANHRGYLVGLAGWSDALLRQVANHRHFDGWFSMAGVGLALLAVFCGRRRFTWNERLPTIAVVVLAVAWSALIGSSVLLGLAAVFGIAAQLSTTYSATDRRETDEGCVGNALPAWLLAAWFCGLLVSTPFYTPFPRLTLPWLMSAWLGTAAAIGWWSQRLHAQSANDRTAAAGGSRLSWWGQLTVLLLVAVVVVWWSPRVASKSKKLPGWQARDGLETIAAEIVRDAGRLAEDQRSASTTIKRSDLPAFVLYVYAEPALVFHLSAIGFRRPGIRFVVQPAGNLSFAAPGVERSPVPTFLVTRPHARRNVNLAEQLSRYQDQLACVGTYDYSPSDLVLLNDYQPGDLADNRIPPEEGVVRLYRLK